MEDNGIYDDVQYLKNFDGIYNCRCCGSYTEPLVKCIKVIDGEKQTIDPLCEHCIKFKYFTKFKKVPPLFAVENKEKEENENKYSLKFLSRYLFDKIYNAFEKVEDE